MFGLIKGCGCRLSPGERQAWVGHVCGLCLALRDHYGQPARLVTNYDAALLSVLCEAQSPALTPRMNHLCPIRGRGFQRATVVAASNPGAQYAASMAILMATARFEDHVADGDGWLRYWPAWLTGLPHRRARPAHRRLERLGFPAEIITAQTTRQPLIEHQSANHNFLFYAQPTELVAGAAFRHTAVIANCSQNEAALYHLGRLFGRIMYLLDSYRDYADDVVGRKFNALAHCFAVEEIQTQAARLFHEAQAGLEHHFKQLRLSQPRLARKLLIQELKQVGLQTLNRRSVIGNDCVLTLEPPAGENEFHQKKRRGASNSDCGDACYWCSDCGNCCGCCTDGSMCCCGDGDGSASCCCGDGDGCGSCDGCGGCGSG